jgi:hypothetical protein
MTGPTRVTKSGNGHSYTLDGQPVPGVTTILSNGIPKPGLIGWAASTTADFVMNRLTIVDGHVVADELVNDLREWNRTRKRPTRISAADALPRADLGEVLSNVRYRDLDEAGGKGTDVHTLAHRIAEGEAVDVPDALAGHVMSYMRFLDDWQPYDALVEAYGINRRWRYMGQTDMIARCDRLPDWLADRIGARSGVGLWDLKTARSGIYAEVALQLEAYRNFETLFDPATGNETPMPHIDFVAAVHVRADGYDVISFDIETTKRPTTFDIFLYCKQVGDWLDWKNGTAATIKSPALVPVA